MHPTEFIQRPYEEGIACFVAQGFTAATHLLTAHTFTTRSAGFSNGVGREQVGFTGIPRRRVRALP